MPISKKLKFILVALLFTRLLGQLLATDIAIVHTDRTQPVAEFLEQVLDDDGLKVANITSIGELSEQGTQSGINPILASQLDFFGLRELPFVDGCDYLISLDQGNTGSTAIIFELKSNSIIGMLPLPLPRRISTDNSSDHVRDIILSRIDAFEGRSSKSSRILLMPTHIDGVYGPTQQAFDLLLADRLEAITGVPVVDVRRLNRYSETQLKNFLNRNPEKIIRIRGEVLRNQNDENYTARFSIREGASEARLFELAELADQPAKWIEEICEQFEDLVDNPIPEDARAEIDGEYFSRMAQVEYIYRPFSTDNISYAGGYALAAQWAGVDDIWLNKILLVEDTNQMIGRSSSPNQSDLSSNPEVPSRYNSVLPKLYSSIYKHGYDRKLRNQIYWVWFPDSLERAERIAKNYAVWIDAVQESETLEKHDLQWQMGYRVLLSLAMPLIASSQGLQHDEWFEASQSLFSELDRFYEAIDDSELASHYSGSILALKTGLLAVRYREADALCDALDKHFNWGQYDCEERAYLQRGFYLINGIAGFYTSAHQWNGLRLFVESRSQSDSHNDKAICAIFEYYRNADRDIRIAQLKNFYDAIALISQFDRCSPETLNQYMSDFKELAGVDSSPSISIEDRNSKQSGVSKDAVWHFEGLLRNRLLYDDLKNGLPMAILNERKSGELYGNLPRISTTRTGRGKTFSNIDTVKKALDPFYELLLEYKADASVPSERVDFLKGYLSSVIGRHTELRLAYSEAIDENAVSKARFRSEISNVNVKRLWSPLQALSPPGDPEQIRLQQCYIKLIGGYYFAIMNERIEVDIEDVQSSEIFETSDLRSHESLNINSMYKTVTKAVRVDRKTGDFEALEIPKEEGSSGSNSFQIFGWENKAIVLSKDRNAMVYDFNLGEWSTLDLVPNRSRYFQFEDKVYIGHDSTISRFCLSTNTVMPFAESKIEDLSPWHDRNYFKFEIESAARNQLLIKGYSSEHTGHPPVELVYDIEKDTWVGLLAANMPRSRIYDAGPYTGIAKPYRIRLRGDTMDVIPAKRAPGDSLKNRRYKLKFEDLDYSPHLDRASYHFDGSGMDIVSSGIRDCGIWRVKLEESTDE